MLVNISGFHRNSKNPVLQGEAKYFEGENEFVFNVKVMIEDDTFIAEGIFHDQIKTLCTRCLKAITLKKEITFRDLYLKHKSDLEKFEKDFPGNIFFVEEGYLNLDYSMAAALEESRSEKIVCSEECKGLCPGCGKNLNEVECTCKEDDIDPRLEVLKNLKI